MYDIKDVNLAPSGEHKIDWVRKNCPLLRSLEDDFKKEQPFKGVRIALSVHLEAKTAYLCKVLKAGGAEMFVTGSNPLTTQDDVAAALVRDGLNVFAHYGCSDEEYDRYIKMVLENNCNIIIDDGGDLVNMLHSSMRDKLEYVIGGCEETTTGIIRLKAMARDEKLEFPMVMVNDADCKHLFEVIVTEVDPVKAIEAVMDGFEVMTMNEAAKVGDFFVTVTGCADVITSEHMKLMKDGAILCNAGHFDVEIDMAYLKENALSTIDQRANIVGYEVTPNKFVYVLGEGRLVNLACGDGHPAEIMDMSFAIQALSAKYLLEHKEDITEKLIVVPREVDLEVANRKLNFLGITIDTLTDEQRKYLNM